MTTEHSEDGEAMTGDLTHGGSIRPVGSQTILKGRLHLRLANVGHPIDVTSLTLGNLKQYILLKV